MSEEDFTRVEGLIDFGNIDEADAIAIGNILQAYQSQAVTITKQAAEINKLKMVILSCAPYIKSVVEKTDEDVPECYKLLEIAERQRMR